MSGAAMAVDTSYLTTQVNNIVEQLHGIFNEIGVPARERESREAEVNWAFSEAIGLQANDCYYFSFSARCLIL